MSDNDVTSGDPWGLSSTETESPPPPPPPASVSPQDELPEDLADLSTIADQDSAGESEPPTLPDLELAVPVDSPEVAVPADSPEVSDVGTDLDLGDFGNFSDLVQDSDLGPIAESALAESIEADAEISMEIVEGAFADLSISEDLPGPTDSPGTGDLPGFEDLGLGSIEEPNHSDEQPRPAGRPMNPLLAASGLFGGSPSLPPLEESAPSAEATADPADESTTEDSEDAPSFDEAISSIQFDDPTSDFESIELTDGDLPDFDVPVVDLDEPADIDAELAETLTALGDQPADAISFSSDLVFGASDQNADSDESSDDRADFYPEFMSQPAPTDEARDEQIAHNADAQDEAGEDEVHRDEAEPDQDEVFAAAFGDTDFSSAGTPPAIYQELEHLGDDATDADPSTPGSRGESVEEFDVVFGGSDETADDPFGAVFGSGDAAIAAVAAAAASIETKPPTSFDHADTPTVDDLPDFMMDDEAATDIEAAVPPPDHTQDVLEAFATDSSDGPATFGLVDSFASEDSLTTHDDAPEALKADESNEGPLDAETGEAEEDFAEAGEEFAAASTDDPAENVEAGESTRQDSESPQGQAAESSGEATDDIAVAPLPPMPLVDTPTPDSDPFAASLADLKVDAAELGVGEAVAGHPPILGTIATGVIAKKPIPEDWGTRSDDAYEGWVQDDDGVETWRMIITNLPTVAGYEIDEFLGLAVADSLVGSHDVHAVAGGRRAAIDALTEDGVLRGAHAIVGVTHAVQSIEHQMLVTVSGTAVTLKPTAVALAD